MSRNRYLDLLKGILIITVVVGHVVQCVYYKGDQRYFADIFFKAIYMWHMPLFMAVAGYLSWDAIKRDSLPKLAWTRFKAYVVPIFAWAILFSAIRLLVHPRLSPSDWLGAVARGTFGEFWFLWALYISILLASVARLAARLFKVAYVVLPGSFLLLPDVWHLSLIKYVVPFFLIGCLLAEQGIPAFFIHNRPGLLAVSILASVICFWAWKNDTYVYLSGSVLRPSSADTMILRYASGLSGSAAVLFIVWYTWEAVPRFLGRCLEAFGRDTICIYLLQGYVFTATAGTLARLALPRLNIFSRSAWSIAVAVLICCALWAVSAVIARSEILAQLLFGKWKASTPIRSTPPPRLTLKPFLIEPR